jgi:HPt (histidine-containing phosphotransfer) domain-containing protein
MRKESSARTTETDRFAYTETKILLDDAMISQLVEIDPSCDLLNSLEQILIDQTKDFTQKLNIYIQTSNFALLSKEAHKLKSSFGSMGLICMQNICKEIELECKKEIQTLNIKKIIKYQEDYIKFYEPSMALLNHNLNGIKYEKKTS